MAKEQKKKLEPVELIDRIPTQNVDLDCLAGYLRAQLNGIEADRSDWIDRREQYLDVIDNLVDFDMGPAPFEGASALHIPVTMEKVRATHARLYQAMFSLKDPFFTEPQEAIDVARLSKIDNLMKWCVSRYMNYHKGIYDVMDDAIWDFSADGWCFLRLRWDRQMRKSLVVEEVTPKIKQKQKDAQLSDDGSIELRPNIRFKEVEKWLTTYEGPVLECIEQENVYLPGAYTIQDSPFVGIRTMLTAHELRVGAARGFYDKKAVEALLECRRSNNYSTSFTDAVRLQQLKGLNQGVDTENRQAFTRDPDGKNDEFEIFECLATFDVDQDSFSEEIIAWYSREANVVIRWTYLDRITKTARRPVYKADYLKRRGRPYAIGLKELLYNLNKEVNVIHNQKVDYGTISNMPFFFFNSGSSLMNQKIKLMPGHGVPVDDVGGILFPQMKSGTAFGFQEEGLLFDIISRVSGITDLNLGLAPSPGDAARTQGNMATLLNEGNTILDMSLRRLQQMMQDVYFDIHQMLVEKLPREFQHLIVGEDGQVIFDPSTGQPLQQRLSDTRKEIAGRVHFTIRSNSAAGNKALMKQNRLLLAQTLMNPINLQFGVVTPRNIYEINKAILEVSDEVDIHRFITKPENAPKPLSLMDEINHLKQGILPEIPLNDDHATKMEALKIWVNSPQVLEGLKLGTINPNAPIQTYVAIGQHAQYAQMLQAQQQAQANGGDAVGQALMNSGPLGPANTGAMQPSEVAVGQEELGAAGAGQGGGS